MKNKPENKSQILKDIDQAIKKKSIMIIKGLSKNVRMRNSLASISPIFSLNDTLKVAKMHARDDVSIALNYVLVNGPRPNNEKLHYHTSLIIGLASGGQGYVDTIDQNGNEITLEVNSGDIVIIPENILHTFHCEEFKTLGYSVLEVGPRLDGQAHHY